MRRDPVALAAIACLVVGSGLLILLDYWATRLIGVIGLFAFIVCGVFAIARPELLVEDEEEPPDP